MPLNALPLLHTSYLLGVPQGLLISMVDSAPRLLDLYCIILTALPLLLSEAEHGGAPQPCKQMTLLVLAL